MNLILNGEGVATAELNPGKVLDLDLNLYAYHGPDKATLAYLVTVLKAGAAGDLAAYRAIVAEDPIMHDRDQAAIWVTRYGTKLTPKEAARVFDWERRGSYRR